MFTYIWELFDSALDCKLCMMGCPGVILWEVIDKSTPQVTPVSQSVQCAVQHPRSHLALLLRALVRYHGLVSARSCLTVVFLAFSVACANVCGEGEDRPPNPNPSPLVVDGCNGRCGG